MGIVIDFDDWQSKRFLQEIAYREGKAHDEAEELAKRLLMHFHSDVSQATFAFPSYLNKASEISKNHMLEHVIRVQTSPEWSGLLFMVAGQYYDCLSTLHKEMILKDSLEFLKQQGLHLGRANVEYICDSPFVTDLLINKPSYAPSVEHYAKRLKKERTWKDFALSQEPVWSKFFLGLCVAQPAYSSLSVRKNYYRHHAHDMHSLVGGIASLVNDRVHRAKPEAASYVLERELARYDPVLRNDIERRMDEGGWIRLPKAS